MVKKTSVEGGTKVISKSAGSAEASRTRHLRPGDPGFGRTRRPPLQKRVGTAAALVLGEELGDLAYHVLEGIRRRSIPAAAGRLVLERLLPPGRPIRLGLPRIRTAADLDEAQKIIAAALNAGTVTAAEARELQAVVDQAWRARKEAEAAPAGRRDEPLTPEERKRVICEAAAVLLHRAHGQRRPRAARGRGERTAPMGSLEMLGYYDDRPSSQHYLPLFRRFYPDRGDFLGFVGDLRSRGPMREAAAAFRGASELPLETCATFRRIPGVGWSDHGPLWRQGYRALMATDTAFHRNPFYHTAGDLPETLDYARFAAAVDGLAGCFTRLAAELPPEVVATSP